jgi:hypothetical protein
MGAVLVAMTTLGLWFHRGLRIQVGTYEGVFAFDHALREFGNVRAQPDNSEDYARCEKKIQTWATLNWSAIGRPRRHDTLSISHAGVLARWFS